MATKTKPKKRGRKPADGVRAMSNSERQRRYRDRVRQVVQSGAGDDTEALRKMREQIAAKAEEVLDPLHGHVLDARHYATDALIWMIGLREAVLAGQGIARGLSRQVARRVHGIEQTLRKLEAAVEHQHAADRRRELSAAAALKAIAETWEPLDRLETAVRELCRTLPRESEAWKQAEAARHAQQRISRVLWGTRFAEDRHHFREGDRYVVFNEPAEFDVIKWLFQNPDPEPKPDGGAEKPRVRR